MTEEKLNDQLYDKMCAEQRAYSEWLLARPPDEILAHAYEYTVREDILCAAECYDLSDEQAKALLRSPCPVADIYVHWEKSEMSRLEDVLLVMEDRANTVLDADREKKQRVARAGAR